MADNSVTTFVNDVSLNSGLSVGGDASFNGNLAIAGGVNIAGSSKVTGSTQFSGFAIYDNFMISNATNQFAGSTTYTGDTIFTGKITSNDMTINGVSVFKGDATYQSNAQVNNNMNILGAADVRYDLNVSQGRVFVAKDLNVTGNSSVTGNTIVTGTSTFTDASKFLGDVSLNGNVDVSGNFTANYPIGSIPASAIAGANDLTGSVTVKGALDVSGNALISGKVGINNNAPSVSLDLSGCSDAVKLPAGTTAQCPTSTDSKQHGLIRFNTETSQFEGFGAGNAWGSLGGVTDVDKNTYISAENTPGADNNELKFYTAGEERLRIDASGNVGLRSTNPQVSLDLSGCTDAVKLPAGTTAQRPTSTDSKQHGYIRFNTETSQFEGFGAGNAWGSLGGVTDVDKNTYISAENTPGADNNELKFYTAGEERLRIDASGNVGLRSTNPQVSLDLSGCTDAVKLPAGTTAQRPTSTDSKQHGYIRFNTETSQFEGFGAGNAWGSLGGVTDVDKNTYISAENTPGADNNELKFYTAGEERLRIDASGNVGLRSTNPQVSLDLSGCTDAVKLPAGTTAQRPTSTDSKQHGYIRFNTETSQFEGFGAGDAWGSLGGVTDVDKNTYISAENTPGIDNNELKFSTAGNERMRIMSAGDVSCNHALNLSSKLITGTTYGSASITPSLAGLASNNWTLTMNNITAVWDASASSQNSSDFAPFRVFDNSFNNTVDTSKYSQDTSGNYVDASGNLVKDASGNSLDASGNVVEVNNELGWISSAVYDSVSGVYTGSNVTNVSVLGDVSGEWLELSSDISHNLTSYSFKSLDYKNFIGAHLLPKVFYIVGKTNDTNAAWVPVHKVVHLAASTDNSYNVTTPTYSVGSSTESAGTTTLIGDASAGYNVTNYLTSNSYYSNYRLIVESKFNTTTDYEDVINRSVIAVGEWILASTAVKYSEVTNTTIDSSAKIGLNSSNQNQLDIIGKINLQDEIVSDVN